MIDYRISLYKSIVNLDNYVNKNLDLKIMVDNIDQFRMNSDWNRTKYEIEQAINYVYEYEYELHEYGYDVEKIKRFFRIMNFHVDMIMESNYI